MLEITLNGKKYQVEEGLTILEAAKRCGVEIPSFCYHPCLSNVASCRICVVKVNGWSDLTPSCLNLVAKDMTIETDCEDIKKAREGIMQFLTLNHPVDCGICDKAGECLLQDYHFKHNGKKSLSDDPKNHATKYYEVGDRILLDNERCIVCSRCARFTQEVSKSHALGIVKRGDHTLVRCPSKEAAVNDAYLDNIIDICPVGALLSKDFMHKDRVWFLKDTRSICPGCDRGCSIKIWSRKDEWKLKAISHKNSHIARITPYINPEVNGHWICNKGRDIKNLFERPRLTAPIKNGKEISLQTAIKEFSSLVKSSQKIAFVLSSWGSNEELEAFKKAFSFSKNIFIKDDILAEPNEVIEDNLLIRQNKNPNWLSAENLFSAKEFPRSEPFDLVVVWGEGFNLHLIDYSTKIVQMTSFKDAVTEKAVLLFPLSTMLERDGHFTNGLGVTSPFYKVFDPPKNVSHAEELFLQLGESL